MRLISFNSYQIILILIIFKINKILSTGKIYTTANNKQYYIENDQTYNWFDAFNGCLKMNMTLVSIETSSKSEEINTLVLSTFGRIYLWIGGIASRHPVSNKYLWITTGHQITATFWHDSYPQFSSSNNEYCLLYGFTSNMKWANYNCISKFGYICEENPRNIMEKQKIEAIEKKYLELQQKLEEQKQLNGNLTTVIKQQQHLQEELNKQKEIEEELKKQLQQIKENNLKECKEKLQTEIKWKRNTKDEDWLKPQLQLGEQQQNQTQTLHLDVQMHQEHTNIIENKVQEKVFDLIKSNDEDNNKYRNIVFQLQHNTYIQTQIPQQNPVESNKTVNIPN